MPDLQNKVAVITGGSRGLGLAIAIELARAGASVVIASRSSKSVNDAVAQLRALGANADGMALDVARLEQVEALSAFALERFGRLDIWVNNAGTAGPYGATLGLTPQDFTRVVDTNILGVYYGSLVALQTFLPQHSGKLINVLGHGYNRPVPWQNAYASSKAWVRSFTRSLAEENRNSGVGIFAFNPGMVLTELLTHVEVVKGSEERLKHFGTIVRMWARPPEVPARKAAWIASSATDGKTGVLFNIFSPWDMLTGAVREGVRRLLRKSAGGPDIQIRSVNPYIQ